MNKILKAARPSRFLKPGRSLLLLMLLVLSTAAFATPTTPTSDFIDNGNGTVTHKTTGLVWMRCSMGQTWDKATSSCTGTAATYTWDAAMALKSNFAGHSDWRLPNTAELQTIVEWGRYLPAINTSVFSQITTLFLSPSSSFWSSSSYAESDYYAWSADFNHGYITSDDKVSRYFVRLVRKKQRSFNSLPLTTPTIDFIDNQDGTVTHKRTGLMWQRCSVGQTWAEATCLGAASTYTYNNALALTSTFSGHNDWRVPNEKELLSIAEYGIYDIAINTTVFPSTPTNDWFWSSSHIANSGTAARVVNFYHGHSGIGDENNSNLFVRLVRGQWTNVVANLPILPDGTIAGDTQGWVNLRSFGNTLGSYMGLTAYMNNSDGTGDYQSTELAFRFAKDFLHIAKATQPIAKKLVAANNGKTGYVVVNGNRINIVAKYYPSGSTTPPVNGSIISQTSSVVVNGTKPGHVSIAKKIVIIDYNTLDVYLFEQNWIAGSLIADSRKMRFTRNAAGEWTGKTTLSNKAVGWLNPEIK